MTICYTPPFAFPLHRVKSALLATLVAVSIPGPVWAEDLVQVFDLARRHDATILAAEAQWRSAAPRLARAKGALLPNVSMSASTTRLRSVIDAADGEFSGRTDNDAKSLSVNLRQPLFNVAVGTDIAIAKVGEQSAQLDYTIALQDFTLRVAQAYFDVLAAQDVLETRRLSKASIAGQLDAAVRRFKSGLAIITDQEDAQARYSLAEAEEAAAENDVLVARLALQRLTGRPDIAPRPIPAQLDAPLLAPGELAARIAQAAQHPVVRRAELALERARLDTRRARAAGLPTVDLVGSASRNRVGGDTSPVSNLLIGRSTNSSLGVELNLPLFAGFTRSNLVKENVLLADQARHNLEAANRASQTSAERAYYSLKTTLARLKALAAAEAASSSSLTGTQRGYKAGLRPNLDVLNAQSLLYQTRIELDRARYDVLMRSLALEAVTGNLDRESLVNLNQMLAASADAPAPR
ncbi:TolC family outer membrane protein [Massilia sp. PAMC28688]|uniref:TolC family outer membrane protein n=1 Tax=Massilia sp. PAMC28688 TaxID=2861283 RepID=UPI001C630780|nr:TolC family outer membrane protein [Massilia sp. PAMC28688]QYF93479.1 TolC family outer membrane protein [Massilia sp. PAMC28688]